MTAKTGREITLERLYAAIRRAKTADLHRAADFLEWAFQVRKGCRVQRTGARRAQAEAWKRDVDTDVRW